MMGLTLPLKAVVQLTRDAKGTDAALVKQGIVDCCRENMAPCNVPKVVTFVDGIPLTAVGKAAKKAWR